MTATKRNSLRTCPHYQCSRTRVSPHAGRFETSLREVRESGTNNGTPCRPLIALRSSKPHNSSRAKESSYQSTDNERLFVGLKKKKNNKQARSFGIINPQDFDQIQLILFVTSTTAYLIPIHYAYTAENNSSKARNFLAVLFTCFGLVFLRSMTDLAVMGGLTFLYNPASDTTTSTWKIQKVLSDERLGANSESQRIDAFSLIL